MLRLDHDFREGKLNSNKGFLEELPYKAYRDIEDGVHEMARKAHNLAPGVRAYKRNIAPLAAIVSLQGYENFGFIIYRTSYSNDTAWEAFMETLNDIMEAQIDSVLAGEGVDEIKDKFLMPIDDDVTLDSGDADSCRTRFKELRVGDYVPYGLDTGVLLMADQGSIKSMADLDREFPAHLWAVDVDFDPSTNKYPEGYDGTFKVQTHSLIHHLYVALGSGLRTPVDVWQMLEKKSSDAKNKEKHDEL
jgi:hypothetical protein